MLKRSKKRSKGAHKDLSGSAIQDRIAEAAYFLAQRRGFEPGRELDDWIAAENRIAMDSIPESMGQDSQPS